MTDERTMYFDRKITTVDAPVKLCSAQSVIEIRQPWPPHRLAEIPKAKLNRLDKAGDR